MRVPGPLGILLVLATILLAGCGGTSSGPAISGAACLSELDRRRIDYRPVEASDPRDSRCTVDTAVRVSRVEIALNKPTTMSCGLTSRLDEFERSVLQPLAEQELGQRVSRIDHLGAYSCRGNTSLRGRLSEHAFGRAIDIAGFRLADGAVINVERDWQAGPYRSFLRRLARRACEYFSVVLTPDSNADHYNHFHFDIGPGKSCTGV